MAALWELLQIRRGVTAVIGSGGKTSLLARLARELTAQGTVILCTTTRVCAPEDFPVFDPTAEEVPGLLETQRAVFLGAPAEHGKLCAPRLSIAALARAADYVLVEADGAKRLPIKAHAAHEPAIPAEAGNVICVVGCEGFGKPLSAVCHRPELFTKLTGCAEDALLTPELAAKAAEAEALSDRYYLNQAEGREALARRFAAAVTRPTVMGSLREGWFLCLR